MSWDSTTNYFGTGVLKSTDGGQTWTRVNNSTLPSPGATSKIEVDPNNPNRVYLVQYVFRNSAGGLFVSGFYLSTDGGINWTRTFTGLPSDLVIHPTNPQTLYLADQPNVVNGGAGLYRSIDGGNTWALIYFLNFNVRDIRVAVTPADPQRIYIFAGATGDIRVVVSTNGGASWINRSTVGIDSEQFGYNTYIFADPANANTLYVGTRDVFKSTDAGGSWTNLTRNFIPPFNCNGCYQPESAESHPDQHAMTFSPTNPNTIFIASDGGISRSIDGGTNFQSLNATLSLTMFVGYALHPSNAALSYGGTQDNGTQRRLSNSNRWNEFSPGDGGACVINPLDPSMVFTTYIYGNISRFRNNGDTPDGTLNNFGAITTNATFGEPQVNPRIAFYPPFVGNGLDSKLYFGTWRLFISNNLGNNWTAPGGATDLTRGGADVLNAIGVSRANPNVIYTGSIQGRAMVTSNGGVSWTDVTAGLPNRAITGIDADPANSNVAYLTLSGFGSGHVFRTTNRGATWTNISGNLPDIPVSALLISPTTPNTLYAGTDIGVFRSTTGGTTWELFNTGMPPVVVMALDSQANGLIHAATYGRGAYELSAAADPCPTVNGINPASGPVGSSVVITGANFTGVSAVKFANNVVATSIVNSDTQITATVPNGAVTGPIIISKADCSDVPTTTFTVSNPPPGDTIALTSGVPQTGAVVAPQPGGGVLHLTQYTIQVPGGANQLRVDLSGNQDVDLYVRFGQRVAVSNGAVVADYFSESPTGNESLTITAASSPSLQAGTYYIGVGNFGPNAANFTVTATVTGGGTTGLQYYPLSSPIRLLDTRAGQPACDNPGTPLVGGADRTQNARLTCNNITIPANAQAIVGNATVVNDPAGAGGFVTLFPSGAVRPTVSNLNYSPGEVVPNSFTVGLGANGAFQIYATSGINFIVDVTGYYAPPGAGGLFYHPLPSPIRLLDTRTGQPACDAPGAPLVGGSNRTQNARLTCGGVTIPANAQAIVGNATVVNNPGAEGGFVTLYPSGAARPTVSNLNYSPGQVVPNSFTVGLGSSNGAFSIYATSGINFIVDVTGYYSDQAVDINGTGLLYNPLSSPIRLLDTRAGQPACDNPGTPLTGGADRTQNARLTCNGITIPANAQAIVGNATVVNDPAGAGGFVTLYPSGAARPTVSNLNYNAGQVVPNAFTVTLGSNGAFNIYATSSINFIVDITGYYAP